MRNFSEILQALREPFPPELHQERDLPGGAKWFFIPWQAIRDRLDEVYPEWVVEYGMPEYLDKYCVVKCKLTIAGVSREALGNAEIELLSSKGKDMSRGTPVERAVADSLKNCAEAFGVAAYLDEQVKSKQEFLIRYLHKSGDGRALAAARENNWVGGSLATKEQKEERMKAEQESRRVGSSSKPVKPSVSRSPSSVPATQPAQPEPFVAPPTNENLDWLRRITNTLGFPQGRGDALIKQAMQEELPELKTAELDVFQRNRVARNLLVSYGNPVTGGKADSLYHDAIANNEAMGGLEPEELAQAWLGILSGQTETAKAS
jgi:hypothetical protein